MSLITKLEKTGYIVSVGYSNIYIFRERKTINETIYIPFVDSYDIKYVITSKEVY